MKPTIATLLRRFLTKIDITTAAFLLAAVAATIAIAFGDGAATLPPLYVQAAILLVSVIPMVAGGIFVGALVQILVPQRVISEWLGGHSGWRGLILAATAGMITPGGPFAAFPLVLALHRAGADIGTTVTYITAWSVIGIHRLIVWELPFLGADLSLLRFAVSIPLPFIAGLLARYLAGFPARDPADRTDLAADTEDRGQ